MNEISFNSKKMIILALICSVIFTIFGGTSSAEENENSSCGNDTVEVPEIQFTPEVINQYKNEEGELVSVYSELPEKFVTDENGNIITDDKLNSKRGGITTQDACSKRYYYETISGPTLIKSNSFIAYHPGFTKWDKTNGYFFGQATQSYSVGVQGFAGISVSVSVAAPGNGSFITANPAYWSRPGIYGDVSKLTRKVTVQDPCGSGSTTYNTVVYQTNNTYNKTVYQ
ncbi:hypothetical protein [Saccharibacillus sp. O23]|uniref:hypothetical protein n=1 Tax=Saccharibacillus sp. O23 TaxID=2009338 RepID=UPI00117B22C9|nr:hypothetical protein [Saccharibacillus sp. O23]